MSRRAQTGYADLVRLVGAQEGESIRELARLFGYERIEREPLGPPPAIERDGGAPLPELLSQEGEPLPPAPVPFWLAVTCTPIPGRDGGEEKESAPGSRPVAYPGWRRRPTAPPFQPLAPWRDLTVRLRHALGSVASGRSIDVDRVVERIGRGEVLNRLPHTELSRWCGRIQVIVDRSRRLLPYFDDQHYVAAHLRRLVAAHDLGFAVMADGAAAPLSMTRDGETVDYQWPPPGTPVLVLGDLGCLAGTTGSTEITGVRRFWLEFGQRLRAAGCRPVALFPAGPGRCPPALAAVWTLVPWERPRLSPAPRGDEPPVRQLLRLVAPALRIEPGLLRAVRRLLPEGTAEAGTEAEVWQHPWLASASPAGATIRPEQQFDLRREFTEKVAEPLRREVARTIRSWRAGLPEEIWFRELLGLDPAAQDGVSPDDLADARQYERAFCAELDGAGPSPRRGQDLLWQAQSTAAATEFLWNDREVGSLLVQLHHRLNRKRPDYRLPPGVTPDRIAADPDDVPRAFTLRQDGENLILDEAPDRSGSFLARLWSLNGLVTVAEDEGRDPAFWKSGTPPPWADAWGRDEYGAWVEFVVGGVRQRLRWIPPGRFWMGSPENEPGRDDDEGPLHEVTISSGYWLFDTACTQALWQAVMDNNPSQFQDPSRPVERVSWDEVREFLARINAQVPGLGLALPSEAQWEYACRAGTTTPYSFGKTISRAQVNCDGKKTVPVASLPANPWGLYEMHGNVREWCVDYWHSSYRGAPTDGSPWRAVGEAVGARVLRGGSWHGDARLARSAYRGGRHPTYRLVGLGFRCARVPVSQADAEPAPGALPGQAEHPGTPPAPRGAPLLRLYGGPRKNTCELPRAPAFHIVSDRERLGFRRIVRPDWAEAMGRDRFGLWAEFTLGQARQRLRWIPPGRFWMGSPKGEPGRYDNEGPRHEVMIGSGYWLCDTPCTQVLWQAVMDGNPSRFQSPTRPVETVSWNEVQEFLARINARAPGLELALPSEAQWEYACRAGTTTPYSFGETISRGQVNYESKETVPVASLPANPWGLYEMHGNVSEWCADHWHDSYQGAPTVGRPWLDEGKAGGFRVGRGGSWLVVARHARAAYRYGDHPNYRSDRLGFRCARVYP